MSNSENTIQYFDTYKTFMGYKYHLNFPDRWIKNELPNTGRECGNCVGKKHDGYAMWRGIVLGYCANCAIYDYKYSRGGGFLGCGYHKEANYYLGKIDLETIGDIAENPEDTIENYLAMENEYQELERKIDQYDELSRIQDDDDEYEEEPDYELEEILRREKEWNDDMDEIYEKHRRRVIGKSK